jgi:hypothetical protein
MRTQPQSGSGQISPANGKFMARSAHHHGQESRQSTLSARRPSDSKSDCRLKTTHRHTSVATKRLRPVAPLTTPLSQTYPIRRPRVAGGGRSAWCLATEVKDGQKFTARAGRKAKSSMRKAPDLKIQVDAGVYQPAGGVAPAAGGRVNLPFQNLELKNVFFNN